MFHVHSPRAAVSHGPRTHSGRASCAGGGGSLLSSHVEEEEEEEEEERERQKETEREPERERVRGGLPYAQQEKKKKKKKQKKKKKKKKKKKRERERENNWGMFTRKKRGACAFRCDYACLFRCWMLCSATFIWNVCIPPFEAFELYPVSRFGMALLSQPPARLVSWLGPGVLGTFKPSCLATEIPLGHAVTFTLRFKQQRNPVPVYNFTFVSTPLHLRDQGSCCFPQRKAPIAWVRAYLTRVSTVCARIPDKLAQHPRARKPRNYWRVPDAMPQPLCLVTHVPG